MTRLPSAHGRVTPGRRLFYEVAMARWLRPVPDALRRLVDHGSATRALLGAGDSGMASGAAHVAAIVALTSAATASTSHAEFMGEWDALGAFEHGVAPSVRERLGHLCEVARRVEVERRLAAGLSVDMSGSAPCPATVEAEPRVEPAAIELYVDVLWLGTHLGWILSLLPTWRRTRANSIVADPRRRGRASTPIAAASPSGSA